MSINVTIERIDSCKLFNKMTKKIFTKEIKCSFDKLANGSGVERERSFFNSIWALIFKFSRCSPGGADPMDIMTLCRGLPSLFL